MRAYIQRSVEAALRRLFPSDDAETALSWWIASEGRAPVVVVGAGFTRNARDRVSGRGIEPKYVPLWSDVLQRFEADLGGSLEGMDALTIAELHAEALGPRRQVDLLLDMLPNERLLLGSAHEALFDLRPAAIVTTNFLDTVLDQHQRAVPIFDDTSAATRLDPVERTEVLYLHGHRSAPTSWVLTRSQYDNLERSRPILLTRVRQLLSQHPVLTLGFSLADPDFHQVQGQIHAQMSGHQPLGLTLLGSLDIAARGSRRESALRFHWEKRRLRLVRFSGGDFGARLTDFLRLPGKIELAVCEKLVREERGFRKRALLVRSVLHDSDAEKRIETDYGWQGKLWRACLNADFTEAERKAMRERWESAHRADMPTGVPPVSAGGSNAAPRRERPQFATAALNEGPGFSLWEFAWLCDAWLGSGRDPGNLVDWLHERITHPDWPIGGSEGEVDVRVAELLILIAESFPAEPKARKAAADAMRLLRRYDPETCSRMAERFPTLREHSQPGPADPLHEIDREMAAGFRASMDGDHVRATESYERAYEAAQRATEPLAAWLAAQGRRYAHDLQRTGGLAEVDPERERRARRYLAEEKEAQRHPRVLKWDENANDRVLNLRKITVDDLQQQRHRRAFESSHLRISNELHFAWRTLRDLEEANAHPIVQAHYLSPLLDHGFGDPATETGYRLTFDVKRFGDWSRQALEDEASHERAVYDKRSASLMSGWLALARKDSSVSAVVGCVKGLESLASFVRNDHVDQIRDVLVSAERRFAAAVPDTEFGPGAVRTFNGSADTASTLAHAWVAWLAMRGSATDFAAFRTWADTLRPRDLLDAHDGIHRLRWEQVVRAGVSADDIAVWLCSKDRLAFLKKANKARFGEPFAVTLWRLASAASGTLSPAAWTKIARAQSSLLPEQASAMIGSFGFVEGEDVLRAGIGVLAAWSEHHAGTRPAALRALRTKLGRLSSSLLQLKSDKGHAALTVSQASVAADALRLNDDIAVDEIQALALRLDAEWAKVLAFCKNNHGQIRHVVDFLAVTIETGTAASTASAQAKILELVAISSSGLDGLSRVLDATRWRPTAWGLLVQVLRDAANGARGRFPGSSRTDLCDLVRHAVLHARGPLPRELQFLGRAVMDLSAHEDAAVANHGAYATLAIAEWGIAENDSALAKEVAFTLRAMANDARPGVRSAAAYALGFLARSAHAELRGLSTALASLAEDPYARVHSEWLQGQRPDAASPGRPGEAPSTRGSKTRRKKGRAKRGRASKSKS